MKERPILFSGSMVRAILQGRKTQTRRVAKDVKHPDLGNLYAPGVLAREPAHVIHRACSYGQPGDRLWVRETWSPDATTMYPCPNYWYAASDSFQSGSSHDCPKQWRGNYADCLACWEESHGKFRWRPSIHMPRKASRISLEVVSVKVERLNAISEEDALAEGVEVFEDGAGWGLPLAGGKMGPWRRHATEVYEDLWESINGPGSWNKNPWVWVVEFKRVLA